MSSSPALHTCTTRSWQQQLASVIRNPFDLLKLLELDPTTVGLSNEALQQFPLRVTHSYLSRMKKGDPRDPLLLQILPHMAETQKILGYSSNPLQEKKFIPVPGLLHKYRTRVLWLTTSACAIHCRYCFRRAFPYDEHTLKQDEREAALSYIASHPEIYEVILSGGDPLAMKDDYLGNLIKQIARIEHITTIRLHTRFPIVLPDRITDTLLSALSATRLNVVMIVHCNHPQEIDDSVASALKKIQAKPIALLNQSVLLKDINDHAETLMQLSQELFRCGVLPYYLHLLDPIEGAAHFDISRTQAKILHQTLRDALPGYLVPRLVVEEPGKQSKTLL